MECADDLKRVIGIAQSVAKEYSHASFSPAHLLKALLNKDIGLLELLLALDKDVYYLEEWADVRIEACPKASTPEANPTGDQHVQDVFREAETIRLKLSKDKVDAEAVLIALCIPGVGFNYEQLKSFPLKSEELLNHLLDNKAVQSAIGNSDTTSGTIDKKKLSGGFIAKYCIDMNEQELKNCFDPVIGRKKEIREIVEILGRRNKTNVLIVGDDGVGKTSLAHGLVHEIVEGNISSELSSTRVFELDFGSLVAGASYKGEIEDRLKGIIKDIQQFEKAMLFVDDIHIVFDKQSGTSGAASILKPELSKGHVTLIGTTSVEDYSKYIEVDSALSRLFEIVKVTEPDDANALRMVSQIIPLLEKHYDIKAGEEIITEAIRLSKRFLKERALPESAIDLIDHAMSGLRNMISTSEHSIQMLNSELRKHDDNKDKDKLEWLYSDIKKEISPTLLAKIEMDSESYPVNGADFYNACSILLENLENKLKEQTNILAKSDIGSVVSRRTGIPLGKINANERNRLLKMEDVFKKRVVGQDHALKNISDAILESRSGLKKAGQPIGSFFFLGPTGTGKTELAKTLSEFLFQDEKYLIRFDMSEFKEEHSAALLYGAPPGYVGYEEGGLLVNKIREKPYSVVLFDEIEKAHSSVFDIFLQILDEGKLHDRLGKEGDFSNAIILFTSNIGSDFIVDSFNKGKVPESNELMDIMTNYFRPEFLGRLTEIIPFAPIMDENVVKIFDIHLRHLLRLLDEKGIELEIDSAAKEWLAKSGYNQKYGARPIVGVIRNQLRRPLSKLMISGEVTTGNKVHVSYDENEQIHFDVN